MNAQQVVAANVAARGYRDGWTMEQFVARQIAKATEELNEAANHIVTSRVRAHGWLTDLSFAGEYAREAFDDKRRWLNVSIEHSDALCSELADLAVVLFTVAEALDFDVIQAAIDKSSADVARGVR